MKSILSKAVDIIHTKVFGRKPGPISTKFIHNLSYVSIGVVLSKLFVMLFQLLAGRLLGATEYGKLALVITLSEFMYIPMAICTTGMVKYLAEKKSDKNVVVSSSLLISTISIIFWFVIYLLFRNQLARFTHIAPLYITAALFLTVSYTIWIFATKLEQGLGKMKTYGLLNFLRALLTFIIVMLLFYFSKVDVAYAIAATFLGYLISSLVSIKDIFKIKLTFDKIWLKKLLVYGTILFIGAAFSIVLKDINKLFVNAFLGVKELGIYQAYTTVTFGFTNLFSAIFTTVFFPESSKRDKKLVWSKIKSVLKYSYLLFLFILVSAAPLIYLYGRDYPFFISYLILFSLAAFVISIYYIFSYYAASFGTDGAKYSVIAIAFGSILNITLSYLLIPLIRIYGAIIAVILSYALAMTYIIIKIKGTLLKNEEHSLS